MPPRSRVDEAPAAPPTEAMPVAKPAAIASVQQACSRSGGFLAEQLCKVQQCQRPENAPDPVCIAYRRMEEQQGRGDAP